IPKKHALSQPSCVYLGECCRRLGLPAVVEGYKRHPKDPLTFGRVKVQYKRPGGGLFKAEINSKAKLLVSIARIYPEVEKAMKEADPMVATHAAASRSQMSKTVEESYKEATKEIKQKEEAASGKPKKNKKKK
ncbi:hypothetical protein HDU76_002692, partial [Blyttiomyces sp. JEL0837]